LIAIKFGDCVRGHRHDERDRCLLVAGAGNSARSPRTSILSMISANPASSSAVSMRVMTGFSLCVSARLWSAAQWASIAYVTASEPAPMTGGGAGLFERSMTSRGATLGGSEIRAVKRFERKYSMAISI